MSESINKISGPLNALTAAAVTLLLIAGILGGLSLFSWLLLFPLLSLYVGERRGWALCAGGIMGAVGFFLFPEGRFFLLTLLALLLVVVPVMGESIRRKATPFSQILLGALAFWLAIVIGMFLWNIFFMEGKLFQQLEEGISTLLRQSADQLQQEFPSVEIGGPEGDLRIAEMSKAAAESFWGLLFLLALAFSWFNVGCSRSFLYRSKGRPGPLPFCRFLVPREFAMALTLLLAVLWGFPLLGIAIPDFVCRSGELAIVGLFVMNGLAFLDSRFVERIPLWLRILVAMILVPLPLVPDIIGILGWSDALMRFRFGRSKGDRYGTK